VDIFKFGAKLSQKEYLKFFEGDRCSPALLRWYMENLIVPLSVWRGFLMSLGMGKEPVPLDSVIPNVN